MNHGLGNAPDSTADNRLAERTCLKVHRSQPFYLGWLGENVAPAVAVKFVVIVQCAEKRDGVGDRRGVSEPRQMFSVFTIAYDHVPSPGHL